MNMPKSWDEYEIKARYIPCLISVIPLVHFSILLLGNAFWKDIVNNFSWLLVVTNVSASLIMMIFFIQIQTGVAKHWIEESIFGQGGKYFPTTEMLLLTGGLLSQEGKTALRKKISTQFNFIFPETEEETKDPENARLRAREAVSAVRRRVGKGIMTQHYNIRYGFFRNLIGGTIWSVLGSLGCIVIYINIQNWKATGLFSIVALFFILAVIFKKQILTKFAFAYADTLFSEYMSK
jgi:hypothetical protein